MRKLSLALLMAIPLAAGVLDNNTVTVTATRTLTVSPDQVLLYVNLLTTPDAGLDAVLAKLNGTGITAANLTGLSGGILGQPVSNPFPSPAALSQWTFLVPLSFSKMKDTVAALTALQSSLGSPQGPPGLTFNVAGTQVSADARSAQPCPLPALVADARKQADTMAAAAGMRTGAVVSVSDGTSADGTAPIAVPPATRSGDFSQYLAPIPISGVLGGTTTAAFFSPFLVSSPQPGCSLIVQFRLLP